MNRASATGQWIAVSLNGVYDSSLRSAPDVGMTITQGER